MVLLSAIKEQQEHTRGMEVKKWKYIKGETCK